MDNRRARQQQQETEKRKTWVYGVCWLCVVCVVCVYPLAKIFPIFPIFSLPLFSPFPPPLDKSEQMCYNCNMSEETKYELLKVEEGVEWRKYPNGHIRNQKGQLLVLPEEIRENHLITSENHHEFIEARKNRYLAAMEAGVTEGARAYGVEEAMSKIMARRAQVALSDGGKAGNDAARIILDALDAYQDKRVRQENVQRQEYSIDPDTMAVLEKLLELKREA